MANMKNYNSNGMWANVYVPENVNENTDVFVFVHGGKEMNNENIGDRCCRIYWILFSESFS